MFLFDKLFKKQLLFSPKYDEALYEKDLEKGEDNKDVVKSGHPVIKTKVSSGSSDFEGKTVFFKHNDPILSLCETAFSKCYALLIGNKVAKVREVYGKVNSINTIIGVCSEAVSGFVDIRTLQNAAKWMKEVKWDNLDTKEKEAFSSSKENFINSQKDSIEVAKLYNIAKKHEKILDANTGTLKFDDGEFAKGLAEVFVASYLFEEDDLHKCNFGVDEKGCPVRIDLDMSFFGSVYAQTRGSRKTFYEYNSTWDISIKDIVNFPILESAAPWYWPTICRTTPSAWFGGSKTFSKEDALLFSKLAENKDFVMAKYRCFLKALLIPDDLFKEIFAADFSDEKVKDLRDGLTTHFENKRQKLKHALLAIPEFRDYLLNENLNNVISQNFEEEVAEIFVQLKKEAKDLGDFINTISNKALKEYLKNTFPSKSKEAPSKEEEESFFDSKRRLHSNGKGEGMYLKSKSKELLNIEEMSLINTLNKKDAEDINDILSDPGISSIQEPLSIKLKELGYDPPQSTVLIKVLKEASKNTNEKEFTIKLSN